MFLSSSNTRIQPIRLYSILGACEIQYDTSYIRIGRGKCFKNSRLIYRAVKMLVYRVSYSGMHRVFLLFYQLFIVVNVCLPEGSRFASRAAVYGPRGQSEYFFTKLIGIQFLVSSFFVVETIDSILDGCSLNCRARWQSIY